MSPQINKKNLSKNVKFKKFTEMSFEAALESYLRHKYKPLYWKYCNVNINTTKKPVSDVKNGKS